MLSAEEDALWRMRAEEEKWEEEVRRRILNRGDVEPLIKLSGQWAVFCGANNSSCTKKSRAAFLSSANAF